jgi:translation initiation factor 5B
MKSLRSPTCVFVGHVDHGKSSILDRIRGTSIVKQEAGGITQKISSSKVSLEHIKKLAGNLLTKLKFDITLPGILFIDTPGHASFTSLRKRGGNIADIAVLVVDIREGFKPQTIEAIEILKHYKTPFILALNKIDLLSGWRGSTNKTLIESINSQGEFVKNLLDQKLYEIVGKLYEYGLNAERFDRVQDYTKQVAIVPVSALTSEGVPELIMIISGLAQRFLEERLKVQKEEQGKGVVLEVNEQKGLGCVLNIILYDGSLKVNDTILVGGTSKIISSKVRGIFEQGKSVKKVDAATSIVVCGPNLDDVSSGMPFRVANNNANEIKKEIQNEIKEVLIETDKDGIIVKADSVGSLEAIIFMLKEKKIKISKASIGEISKKDIIDAESQKDELNKVILGFNVKNAKIKDVEIITNDIIYKIIENFGKFREEKIKEIELRQLQRINKPCKIVFLRNYIFRQSNPAVIGVEILTGTLKVEMHFIKKDGIKIGEVKSIQSEGKGASEAEKGKQVAVSLPSVTVGRQITEGDVFISDINESDFRKLKDMKRFLNQDEVELLKEIISIKRKENPLWGV